MPFLELSLTLHATQQASVEAALEDLGALSITLADADVNTPDERAIFEPGVGETPVWNAMLLQALLSRSICQHSGLKTPIHYSLCLKRLLAYSLYPRAIFERVVTCSDIGGQNFIDSFPVHIDHLKLPAFPVGNISCFGQAP